MSHRAGDPLPRRTPSRRPSPRRGWVLTLALAALALASCTPGPRRSADAIDRRVAALHAREDLSPRAGGLDSHRILMDADAEYAAGAELIAWTMGDEVVRLDLTAFGNLGRLEDDYAFSGGQLVRAKMSGYRFSRSDSAMALERRQTWYFSGGRLLLMRDGLSGKDYGASAQLGVLASSIQSEASRLLRIAQSATAAESEPSASPEDSEEAPGQP